MPDDLHALPAARPQLSPSMRLAVPAEELTLDTGVLTGGRTRLPVTW
jgi:hypothetical protein